MKTQKLTLFLAAILLQFSIYSFATSYTWKGITNANWYTPTNWSPNGIPGGSGDNITIASDTRPF